MSFNPYQPPTSAYDGAFTNYGNTGASVPDRTVAALRKTRPWVVFLSVLAFISTGFMVLGALGVMTTMGVGFGLFYLVLGAIYLLPAVAMNRYGTAINKLLHGGGTNELDQAMEAQASFWQIAGIMALVGIVVSVIAVIAGVALGASMMNGL